MANFGELEANWNKRFAEFEKRLEAETGASSPNLGQLMEDFKCFKKIVQDLLGSLKQQVRDCVRAVDSIDMQSRLKILLINGVTDDPATNIESTVLNLINSKLGMSHITSQSIKRCHRIGAQVSDRTRPLLVHFHDFHIKAEVWKAKSKLKGSGVSLSEFLTKARVTVYKNARKHFGNNNVWSMDGVIHIKVPGGGHEKIIYEEDLAGLVSKFPEAVKSVETTVASTKGQQPQISSGHQKSVKTTAQLDDVKKLTKRGKKV